MRCCVVVAVAAAGMTAVVVVALMLVTQRSRTTRDIPLLNVQRITQYTPLDCSTLDLSMSGGSF